MPSRLRFEIRFDKEVAAHFAPIERKDRGLIFDEIERQLTFEPAVPTRNRKALRIPNSLNATWELRCGANNRYRVFYDIDLENRLVIVLAVGHKQGNTLIIGKEKIEL
jgi:mRNA-degrading endonuclease RelE of RelBE toxin-antitoxin system